MRVLLRSGRPLLSLGLLISVAALGAITVVGYAPAPVEQETHVYSFRPSDSQATGAPGDPVIAPLPLLRTAPDSVETRFGCEQQGSSQFRSMTLGNWEGSQLGFPVLGVDLQVRLGLETFVALGGSDILSAPVVMGPGCEVTVGYQDGQWRLAAGDDEWTHLPRLLALPRRCSLVRRHGIGIPRSWSQPASSAPARRRFSSYCL